MIDFIRNLFFKNESNSSSLNTIKDELERMKIKANKNTSLDEWIFISIIGPVECIEEYNSNIALFELTCSLFLKIDLYLFNHHPEARILITKSLMNRIDNLYSYPLKLTHDEFRNIFDERVQMYGKMIRMGKKPEDIIWQTSSVIADSMKYKTLRLGINSRVPIISFKEPVLNDDFSVFQIQKNLITWESYFLPKIFNIIEHSVK